MWWGELAVPQIQMMGSSRNVNSYQWRTQGLAHLPSRELINSDWKPWLHRSLKCISYPSICPWIQISIGENNVAGWGEGCEHMRKQKQLVHSFWNCNIIYLRQPFLKWLRIKTKRQLVWKNKQMCPRLDVTGHLTVCWLNVSNHISRLHC